jgi:DNA polymerase III epsilon subunit-like protein
MNYIAFDLEFNQDFSSIQIPDFAGSSYPFEIIQFGAVKLDSEFHTISTFNRYVKPSIYANISPFITELTKITSEQLATEATLPEVYHSFLEFLGEGNNIFCVWGMADLKELFRSADYYKLDHTLLPRKYINLQPYASLHFGLDRKKLLRLQFTVEALGIPLSLEFHNALNDSYYTAEILKGIYTPAFQPELYEPVFTNEAPAPRRPKRITDYVALLKQFEKMYNREMTEEEQNMIKLAYNMGKTHQFIK